MKIDWAELTERIRRKDTERPLAEALPDLVHDVLVEENSGQLTATGSEYRERVCAAATRYWLNDGACSRSGDRGFVFGSVVIPDR